jgi:hypothetical protein
LGQRFFAFAWAEPDGWAAAELAPKATNKARNARTIAGESRERLGIEILRFRAPVLKEAAKG